MDKKDNGIEIAPLNPGWIKKKVPDEYADDGLLRIIRFYVINTPCTELSYSGKAITEYGWKKDIWKKDTLKNILFDAANLKRGETFVVAKKTNEMRKACEIARLKKGFQQSREIERMVLYKNKKNEFLSVFYHIRNAFAHGRMAMYSSDKEDIVFVLEDGINKNESFIVRSRMILKRQTLLKWIDIIEKGYLEDD